MLHKLRQVAFLVDDLPGAAGLYRDILGMEPSVSGELSQYSLTNMALPAGEGTFVELLQPTSPESAGGRFLSRRGEAPYMLIFETKEFDRLIDRLKSMDVRITGETRSEDQKSAFIHPSSANGAFLEIIEVNHPENPWPAAGPDWYEKQWNPQTRQLRQSAILVRDLDQAVGHWEEMFGLRATQRFQISFTDLEIAVIPLAGLDTFIELAQPTSHDTTSARFLERYGEGIYLTIYQINDSLAMDDRLKAQGVRYTSSRVTENYTNMGFNSIWLHLRAMRGVFTQLSQVLDAENPWPPAGDSWYK